MYRIYRTRGFEKSYQRLKESGKFKTQARSNLKIAIDTLAVGKRLPAKFEDHALTGDFLGYRECHIKGNLLLIYQLDEREGIVDLVDIGSHPQLFG